jgi:hypothetical protein
MKLPCTKLSLETLGRVTGPAALPYSRLITPNIVLLMMIQFPLKPVIARAQLSNS